MESQLVATGPGHWRAGSGYAFEGNMYALGGDVGDFPAGDLWGYKYVIEPDSADAQP